MPKSLNNIKRGLKRFDYENGYVWALNEKNAKRKISKIKYKQIITKNKI